MLVATSKSATEKLAIVELPSRPLKTGEVRVKVESIGVNPVDWKMREGGPLRLAYQVIGPSGPQVVGLDFAGTVSELGANVTELAVGDRVVGGTNFARKQLGSYATEVVARPDQCAKLPPEVSFDQAACLPVAAVTAWMALREHTKIGPGNKVLVLGASGGVGHAALQLTKMLGAQAVGVCSSRNVAFVEETGAIAVDYTKGDALEAARPHGPYDLILHAVGTDTYPLGVCRSLLAPGGRVELVVIRPADYLAVGFLPSVGTTLGEPTRERLTPLVAALARGDLRPLIAEKIPLAEAERAHELSRAGKVVGKLLLVP
jgi:NADPH:quinone reductase-like Zn-dependent oxidoreductase